MNSTSTVRVKEKIRFDINFHREQNKRILLNSRRGVIDEGDQNDVFTIEDMQNVALEIVRKKPRITVNDFKLLKHGLLNGQEFILAFCHTHGAVDSLLHCASSKNEAVKLVAIECFCNMALGNKKTCIKLANLITPYFMVYINSFNFNISSVSIWTLGNLSGSDEDSCRLLQNQNLFGALIDRLKSSTCDEVILNTFYALKLFLKTYIYHLKNEELNELLHICLERLNSWNESFWIVYQISCRQDCAMLDQNLIKRLFLCIHTDEDMLDIKCIVSIIRTFGNIIAMDNSGNSANEFIIGLHNEGSVIRNILIKNRHINLNNECAWLLGNVYNVLKFTENEINSSSATNNFSDICNYLIV
ncbi:Armadillo-type fold,Armadillo-like helical [Cinara cedri]|uniref:Armadillo-type fold,Armadillo-like helical n=1 Tax=Cinara cedri TaxID=506608 RepID=A0A5E4MLG3_9HEMI|nr:Armadillo-type fold,Armadillo-like helical [Cinara cedri]